MELPGIGELSLDNPYVGVGLGVLGLVLSGTIHKGISQTIGYVASVAAIGYSGYRLVTGTTPSLFGGYGWSRPPGNFESSGGYAFYGSGAYPYPYEY